MKTRLLRAFWLLFAYALTAMLSAFLVVRFTARGSMVSVPALVGSDLREVQGVLGRRGLEMTVVSEKWSEVYPAGCVMAQIPAANTRIKRGRRVRLTLSRGSKILDMPSLAGRLIDEARFVLRQLGVDNSTISTVPSQAAKGTVLAQDPPVGRKIPRDFPVRLLLSSGPPAEAFLIPSVRGLSTRDGLARLRKAELKITEIEPLVSGAFPPGTILSQNPPAGFRAIPGDAVKLKTVRGQSGESRLRYIPLITVKAPPGPARRIRVVIVDENGRREIANEVVKGDGSLKFPARVTGEAVAQIYIGGVLVKEHPL